MRTRLSFGAVTPAAFAPPSVPGLTRWPPCDRPRGFAVKGLRRCAGVVLSLACLSSFAAPASGAEIFVSRTLKAEIGANDGILIGRSKQWDEHPSFGVPITPDNTSGVVTLAPPTIVESVTAGGATAGLQLGSKATAQIGHLSVHLFADAFARNSNLIDLAGVTVGPNALETVTSASWRDRIVVHSNGTPDGTPLVVSAKLRFQTGAIASVAGGPAEGGRTGTARARVSWVPIGVSLIDVPQSPELADASDNLTHTITISTGGGEFEFDCKLEPRKGDSYVLGAALFASGSVGIVSTDPGAFPNAGEVHAFFESDASRSLTWGGITGVANALTGEPITDWTVTSESGFDYSRPFEAVPEPASLVLLLAAGSVLARPARRLR